MLMIMKSNSKKCSTMRKFITTMLIAAAAFTACVQNDEVVVPNNNDKITFTATVTAPQTRTVLVEEGGKFHAEWVAGEDYVHIREIKVTSSTKAKSDDNEPRILLTTGGKTATFPVSLTPVTADSFYYILGSNKISINGPATKVAFSELTGTQAPTSLNSFDATTDFILSKPVYCTTQPTSSLDFETTRINAIAKVTIKVPTALALGDAIKSVTFACDKPIAGKVGLSWDEIVNGTPLNNLIDAPTEKQVIVTLPTAQSANFSYYMNVWPATLAKDSKVTVTLLTNNDKKFIKEVTLPEALEFVQGDMTTLTVNMSAVAEYVEQTYEPIEGTVNVAGIYWALGNLEYEVDGDTDTGFATGWRIAPTQYHHFYIGTTGDIKDTITDYDKVAHFNYGGIGSDGTHSFYCNAYVDYALHLPADGTVTDISGKIFTDAACTTPASSWADAVYGDIAYWASKGEYRMPTTEEFDKLYTEACITLASYSDGTNTINGTYFYNPGADENPGWVEGTKTIKDTDLAVGLFLPWIGRRYDNNEYNIYAVGSYGGYRTSTVHNGTNPSKESPLGYGGLFAVHSSDSKYRDFDNKTIRTSGTKTYAYGACARFAIRPVKVTK